MSADPDQSTAQLEKLGYKQDLDRTLTFFANFGIAFCYISPVVGVYSLFGYGLSTAGPAFVWSIPIVAGGQFLVALVFAEVASAYPLAIWLALWMTGRAVRERLVAAAFAVGLAVYTGIFATWHWVA